METKKSKKKIFIIIFLVLAAIIVFEEFGPFAVLKMYDWDAKKVSGK